MSGNRKLSEQIDSEVNVIIARFLVVVFAVCLVVTVLTYTGIFLTTLPQMFILLLVAAPGAVYGFLVLLSKWVRNDRKTKYIVCILMCIQAFGVALAVYSYVGTIILLLPVLLAALYPKSKVSICVSAAMIGCGLLIPPLALFAGFWDGDYYEFLYDLSFGRQMDTAMLSDEILSWQEQLLSVIRFCSSQNALIVGGFAFIGRLIYRQTNKFFDSQRDVIRLSETDELTGLLNRNCFERRLNETVFFNNCSLVCFYFDVNGLHEMNNKEGHKAGDAMLQFIGKQIQEVFGEDNTFRVGGDEYVAFSDELELQSIQFVKDTLENAFASRNYHVAIGYAESTATVNMNDLIGQAEKEMYLEKKKYYIDNNIVR